MHLDVLQNLDEQNLDVNQPFLDVVPHFLVSQRGVVVDAEPLLQLKMDCFLDVVDVEPLHQLKRDCFLDVEPVLMELVSQLLVLHHFLRHARRLHALPPLPYWRST